MPARSVSRRRALKIAGAAAVPGVLVAGGATNLPSISTEVYAETRPPESQETPERRMELGAFSISLAVKDLEASRKFYEKFGFKAFAGNPAQRWQILKNGAHVIGLFQGMFDKNMLTFNPGWDQNAKKLATFTDVRELQRQLKAQGVKLMTEADEHTKGPASFMAMDPDGNPVLVDQHV